MATLNRLTGGRVWAARLSVLALLGALGALIFAIVPVLAAPGDDIPPASGAGVLPIEVDLGGQNNDCSAPEIGLGDIYDFRIEDPNGVYVDTQSGFPVTFTVSTYNVAGEEFMDFTVDGASVEGLVIKGGSNSAFYAYSPSVSSDTGTHATRKTNNNKLYQVSHASFCYDIVGSISGTKFHDKDTDGLKDPGFREDEQQNIIFDEPGLAGWVITAFDSDGVAVGSDTTDADGNYSIPDISLGQTYTVCETTNTAGLPAAGASFTWAWTQSILNSTTYPFYGATNCAAVGTNQQPGGHEVLLGASVSGIDFGNHRQITVDCSDPNTPVVVTLGGEGTLDDPISTVTFPTDCDSELFTSSFDVGRSDDSDQWTQFVVFGGQPGGTQIIEQTTVWDAEPKVYRNSSGAECTPGSSADCELSVRTTLVQLAPGGVLQPAVFCSALDPIGPNSSTPYCQDSRLIAEGGLLPAGVIQLTESFRFLGDPSGFR